MERSKPFIIAMLILGACFSNTGSAVSESTEARPAVALSLKDATRLALQNSFDIQLAKYDTWIARTGQDRAESIYDTILNAEIKYRNDQSATSSTIAGTKALDNDYNIGLSKKLPTGTTVGLDLENNRHRTNSAFASNPLTHDSTIGISIEQELGKNFFGIQDRGDVKITKIEIQNTEYTSLEKIEKNISDVQHAYWDLVLQRERVEIQAAMESQAKRLYKLHQEKLKDGLIELPEALASEANYKKRQSDLLLEENRSRAKENVLKLLLNLDSNDLQIKPVEDFQPQGQKEDRAIALKLAFEHRQDYKKAHNKITSRNIKLSMKKNNIWPEINLTATLDRNGLGDHFKQAISKINSEDNPDLFAGLTITLPLENRDARAQLKEAELQKARAILEFKFLERKIAIEIMDHVRDCNIFRDVVTNTKQVAQLQEQKLKEEEKRFRWGRSGTDTLIRFQDDLVEAQAAAAEAKHRYQNARVTLYQKSGILLNQYWEEEL